MKRNTKEKQYEEVYRRYVNDVYKVCIYYLQDEKLAQDVVVDAFEKLYKHFGEVNQKYILRYLVYEAKAIIQRKQGENLLGEGVME